MRRRVVCRPTTNQTHQLGRAVADPYESESLTVVRPEGLVYFACVAPRNDYTAFSPAFASILDSIRFNCWH